MSLLLSASVPKCYCAEAVLTATLLINITFFSVTANMSPYSRSHGQSFDYSLLRTFECVCFVLLSSHEWDKLSSKTSKCIFSGIALLIKDIDVVILLPNDFALLNMCHPLKMFLIITLLTFRISSL